MGTVFPSSAVLNTAPGQISYISLFDFDGPFGGDTTADSPATTSNGISFTAEALPDNDNPQLLVVKLTAQTPPPPPPRPPMTGPAPSPLPGSSTVPVPSSLTITIQAVPPYPAGEEPPPVQQINTTIAVIAIEDAPPPPP